MRVALAEHDVLVRRCIERNHGVVFKTVGDAFCAAFADSLEAVTASVEAQRDLAKTFDNSELPIRVRMALHAGTAQQRCGDYFGQTLNRIDRIMSTAHGLQIVLSNALASLVQDRLPSQITLLQLGKHRLKDLREAEEIHQLCVAGLLQDFPPLRSLSPLSTNLPLQVTSFIGREFEMADVKRLLESGRLVTLIGSGGTGKTRLSLQIGAELLDEYKDGVWLAEFASITNPDLLVQTIASALHVREEPGRELLRQTLPLWHPSATDSTEFRWQSSWQRHEFAACRCQRSTPDWTIVSGC